MGLRGQGHVMDHDDVWDGFWIHEGQATLTEDWPVCWASSSGVGWTAC